MKNILTTLFKFVMYILETFAKCIVFVILLLVTIASILTCAAGTFTLFMDPKERLWNMDGTYHPALVWVYVFACVYSTFLMYCDFDKRLGQKVKYVVFRLI